MILKSYVRYCIGFLVALSLMVANLATLVAAVGTFTPTGSMAVARNGHTATILAGGKVLVAGGYNQSSGSLASAELYDPANGTFTGTTGSMADRRYLFTATRLTDGRVLVAGGYDFNTNTFLATAEIYDPASGTFATTTSMTVARGGCPSSC